MNATPSPITSPYVAYSASDYQGKVISLTITFDAGNNLTGATVFRDPACLYQHVYIGVGPDGTPNTSSKVFFVPAGTTQVSKAQCNAAGMFTVNDVLGTQITAGP